MTIQDDIQASDVGLNQERLDRIATYFAKSYLDSGKLPCMATMVSRNGQIVHEAYRGRDELDGGDPINADTIFRIYSMTKPITSVAAMMLFEEGKIRLDHPVSRYIPEFAETKVWVKGTADSYDTRDPLRPMEVRDLFTHTSGLTYGFLMQHEVDELYRKEKIGRPDETLEEMCVRLAKLPLLFSPGTRWNYSHSIDVLARVVEVASGQTLDAFFEERIFGPLGMVDTGFYVPEEKWPRLMACYARHPVTGKVDLSDGKGAESRAYRTKPPLLNGGGGLVSTLRDYHRFCQMLLHGGSLDGTRILSPKTVEFMRMNHLPENKSIKQMGDKTFSEARMDGNGFGLGGSVTINVAETMSPGSIGTFSWGGLANTFFWIDYEEELIAIQATQMMPSGCYPIRPQFQQLVYAAIDW
ncbi:serine hydrolase domain-containing protein [Henriciella litoralis]|uniref:serine hydrolase domain-containing protein n=1 Tax=Henriciella litoralis TaxID=568102 RepID=UPI000A01D1AB|nr:serine hydrolase domain-containing protein [Henriciella litoralis]